MQARTRSKTQNGNQDSSNKPTRKRELSPEPNQKSITPTTSKKRKMSSTEFEALKVLITQSYSAIETKIDDSQKNLEVKFSDLASNVNNEVSSLKSCVGDFEKKITDDIGGIKSQLNHHMKRIENTEDDIQRMQLNQDLRLIGFAFKEQENLLEIFNQIANEIGFVMNMGAGTPILERLNVRNKTTNQIMPSPTILIHFAVKHHKQTFYSFYLNKMPLDPRKFGLPEENRIILGENLTRMNAQLFKKAQSLRKEKRIAQTFTENGLIKIRFNKGKNEQTHIIRNTIELETLVAQNEITLQSNGATSNECTQHVPQQNVAANNTNNTSSVPMDTSSVDSNTINESNSMNNGAENTTQHNIERPV